MTEYVLTSPQGTEYRTGSAVLRSRLISQGYSENKTAEPQQPEQAPARQPRQRPNQGGATTTQVDSSPAPVAPSQ